MNVFLTHLNSLAWLLFFFVGMAAAHENHDVGNTDLYFGIGYQYISSDNAYPAARLSGVLESGSAREDERGGMLSYAEVGFGTAFNETQSVKVKLAKHANTDPEVEMAWFEDRNLANLALSYRLGRQMAPLGFMNLQEVHNRESGIAPIAMRAVMNDAWTVDGGRMDYQLGKGFDIGFGLWHNETFPGSPNTAGMNMRNLRLGWKGQSLKLEAGYAQVESSGRALISQGTSGHTHSLPSCDTVDQYRVCFKGDADIFNLAAEWKPQSTGLWLGGEWFVKQDKGLLDSYYGLPTYTGTFSGGWMDIGYAVSETLNLRFRLEQGVVEHRVNGSNATQIAKQAGILNSDNTLSSYGLIVNWRPKTGHLVSAEWHRENILSQDVDVMMLRYHYSLAYRL
jgi:hypothetical protein